MPGRTYSYGSGYRYGFNGKENDNEVKGEGNSLDFGERVYDPRVGRWLSVDPLSGKYSSESPYVFSHNTPVSVYDPDGKDGIVTIKGNTITVSTRIFIFGNDATAAAAKSIQQSIMSQWSLQSNGKNWTYTDKSTKKVYDVKFDVSVELYKGKEKATPFIIPDAWNYDSRNNYVEVDNNKARSNTSGGDEGVWSPTDNEGWTVAHEWGHILGLDDRYDDAYDKATDAYLGSRAHNKWQGNIMAEVYGSVEQKNIDELVQDHVNQFNANIQKAKEVKEKLKQLPLSMQIGTGDGLPVQSSGMSSEIPTEYKGEIDRTPKGHGTIKL